MGICHTGFADSLPEGSGWNISILIRLASCQQNLYDIYEYPLLCTQYQTPDDGQKTCPKHVESYSKNKFEKLVHLVGFIVIIYRVILSLEAPNYCLPANIQRVCQSINGWWTNYWVLPTRRCNMSHFKCQHARNWKFFFKTELSQKKNFGHPDLPI